jgi:hypothetical protein
MNRLTFDPAQAINAIDGLQTILIGFFAVFGVWTVGCIAVLLLIRGAK